VAYFLFYITLMYVDILLALITPVFWGLVWAGMAALPYCPTQDRLRFWSRILFYILLFAGLLVMLRVGVVMILYMQYGWPFVLEQMAFALPLLLPTALLSLWFMVPYLRSNVRNNNRTLSQTLLDKTLRTAIVPSRVVPIQATTLGALIGSYLTLFIHEITPMVDRLPSSGAGRILRGCLYRR
jgi:hypothetical protein